MLKSKPQDGQESGLKEMDSDREADLLLDKLDILAAVLRKVLIFLYTADI